MSDPARKILVVDDDPDLLRLLTIRLKSRATTSPRSPARRRALAQLSVTRPHLVVTDLRMGGMDGIALFDVIHRTYPTLPVIML
jgi:two-component system response regulator GlrR